MRPTVPTLNADKRSREDPVLSDLAALTPPLLVAAAFLVAVVAFLRHEMRDNDSPADTQPDEDSDGSRNPDQLDQTPDGGETAHADRKDGSAASGG